MTQGALRYLFNTPNTNWGKVDGVNEAYGVLSDCVYGGTVAGGNTTLQSDQRLGFQCRLRALLDAGWHTSLYGA